MSKRTKIVATVGPSTSSEEVLKSMIKEGVNVFRVNFSHGIHQDHINAIKKIRTVDEQLGTHSAILADLQGPKIRIGDMPEKGLLLENNQEFILTTLEERDLKKSAQIFIDRIPKDVKKGEKVLLDDGKIHLEIVETNLKDTVKTRVVAGGLLFSKKGLNLPETNINISSLTVKDKADLVVALEQKVDWIGFSFVRSAREVIELRHLINSHNGNAKIIAKIEKPEAVSDLHGILVETDAVMVARGDLGVEIPLESVPLVQKKIVSMAQDLAKPVIIATQMMESMMDNITPNRAEVNDVANAVMDGADAVMLSGETSVGKHPIEVIKIMTRIINGIADVVNADPDMDGLLRVVFLPDYNVKLGEQVYPATDLSEQISTAGKEASGTGNMKFAMNGALTIGTLDGANVEIRDRVGAENFFLFGKTESEIMELRDQGYSPNSFIAESNELQETLKLIEVGHFSNGDSELFRPIINILTGNDPFFVMADFDDYLRAQDEVSKAWKKSKKWNRMALLNTARSGFFSSDRSIREYCESIWKVKPLPVEISCEK